MFTRAMIWRQSKIEPDRHDARLPVLRPLPAWTRATSLQGRIYGVSQNRTFVKQGGARCPKVTWPTSLPGRIYGGSQNNTFLKQGSARQSGHSDAQR